MDAKSQARYEVRARIVKALAHPARLFIVDELSRPEEKCVCKLAEMVGTDVSTVSRHLAVLRAAGILQDRKCGQQVFYRLRAPCIAGFFECLESVVRHDLLQKQEALAPAE